jgi:hypothetical protein
MPPKKSSRAIIYKIPLIFLKNARKHFHQIKFLKNETMLREVFQSEVRLLQCKMSMIQEA